MQSFKTSSSKSSAGRSCPAVHVITLVTLAAGVGANTVVFSVLEGVLFKPLPYPKPDELSGFGSLHRHPAQEFELSPPTTSSSANKRTSRTSVFMRGDSVSVTGIAERSKFAPARHGRHSSAPGHSSLAGPQHKETRRPRNRMPHLRLLRRKFVAIPQSLAATIIVDGKSRQIIGALLSDFISLIGRSAGNHSISV